MPGDWAPPVLGTVPAAAKPLGAAMGLSWLSSTDVKGLCLRGGAEALGVPAGHPGLRDEAALQAWAVGRHWHADRSALVYFCQPAWQI